MVELVQGCDASLEGRVVMGIAHNALSVAAECRRRIRDLRRIPAYNDQRSPFRSSLAGNCQTDAGAATNYDNLLALDHLFGHLESKQLSAQRLARANRRSGGAGDERASPAG